MVGSATFTIVASRMTMNCATQTRPRTAQRFGAERLMKRTSPSGRVPPTQLKTERPLRLFPPMGMFGEARSLRPRDLGGRPLLYGRAQLVAHAPVVHDPAMEARRLELAAHPRGVRLD